MSIEEAIPRTAALRGIAEVQHKAGNGEAARTTAHRAAEAARAIQDPSERVWELIYIATAYVDMGDMERARTTIDRTVTPCNQPCNQREMGRGQ